MAWNSGFLKINRIGVLSHSLCDTLLVNTIKQAFEFYCIICMNIIHACKNGKIISSIRFLKPSTYSIMLGNNFPILGSLLMRNQSIVPPNVPSQGLLTWRNGTSHHG